MIELKLQFNNLIDLEEFVRRNAAPSPQVALPLEPAPVETSAKEPAKRGRKPKAEVVVETMAAPVEPTTPAPAAPTVEQKTKLINAFRNLSNAKGTDPVVALLKGYGAASVSLIPFDQWRAAIEAAASAAGLTVEQAMATPPSSK